MPSSDLFEIAPYQPEDKVALLGLLDLLIPTYFAPEERADFAHYLDHEREVYFVLRIQGQIAGGGGINIADEGRTGKISWDLIHPDFHGQSLGKYLLRHRIAYLEHLPGIRHIHVRTSQMAYRFYEKQGFVLRTMQKDYWAPGFDLYWMEWPWKDVDLR